MTARVEPKRVGFWPRVRDEFALGPLASDYKIPAEANGFWYSLGGILAIMLGLEVITGLLLTYEYVPDALRAYDVTAALLASPSWALVLKFHFWNSWLICLLILAHLFRVFVTGGYLAGKKGLWLTGVALAILGFVAALTGEALHWDEVGFGMPWNMGEVLGAFGLQGAFHYTGEDLLNASTATSKLVQIYAAHLALVPLIIGVFVLGHFYLIRAKGISIPYWRKESGRKVPFTSHIGRWFAYSGIAIVLVLLASLTLPHDAGIAPQVLPSSPYFGQDVEPGGLVKPTFPISWTSGMNTFVAKFGVDPDIWGSIGGMLVMLVALMLVPWVDRRTSTPVGASEAFSLRQRGWAMAMVLLVVLVLAIGFIETAITPPG